MTGSGAWKVRSGRLRTAATPLRDVQAKFGSLSRSHLPYRVKRRLVQKTGMSIDATQRFTLGDAGRGNFQAAARNR